MRIPELVRPYIEADVIAETDAVAVNLLVEVGQRDTARAGERCDPSLVAWVAMCLAVRTPRDRHTCVDLERAHEWAGDIDFAAADHPAWPATAAGWIAELGTVQRLVGAPRDRKPFILDGTRLYLARSLAEEEEIARVIRGDTGVAVRILLGGPGTGKTTTVAADLARRFAQPGPPPRLALAAPTAKAAARMTDVLRSRCADERALAELGVTVDAGVRQALREAVDKAPATTIHKLLGASPHAERLFEFGPRNHLPFNLVIVDECSMVASTMMHRLLTALAPASEIRLVGDPDQLVSVEAGSVLADIRDVALRAGWEATERALTLTEQRRFQDAAEIAQLAAAIRDGRADDAIQALATARRHVHWVREGGGASVAAVADQVVREAREMCDAAQHAAPDLLARKERIQVLCANREGGIGVSGWNRRIESGIGPRARAAWYAGRPVMVTRNSRALGLANGDVGVVVPGSGERMEAVFGADDRPVRVPVTRLEHVATVHAMTIHKSQGSEYDHAVVVLPDRQSRLLTRELLYTAVTRARNEVTVIGSEEVIRAAVGRPIRRATGLAERLVRG